MTKGEHVNSGDMRNRSSSLLTGSSVIAALEALSARRRLPMARLGI